MAYAPYAEPTPTLRSGPPEQLPSSVKMQREYAQELLKQKQSKNPFYTWANGLDDMSRALMGGLASRQADVNERAYIDAAQKNTTPPGYPMPTGASSIAAPGGAAASSPFPQDSQAGSEPSLAKDSPSRDDLSTAAMRLSTKGETGKDRIMPALFNISADTGGSKSYGPFGLNSKSGSVDQFVKDNPQFGFTAKPGTPEFDAQWRKAAATDSEGMKKAHSDWHQKNIMGGLSSSMINAGVDPKIANDPRVQTYMADRKVQMGSAGLNAALANARNAADPQTFIRAVSQTDKARIPANFQSYLKDHPNDIKGLANRIDLRHNTALSGADPDLTASMVDFYKNGNKQDSGAGQPPIQVAQNTVTGAPTAQGAIPGQGNPFGALQTDFISAYRGLMAAGMNPTQALENATKLTEARKGFQPQFTAGDYGQIQRTAPGEVPSMAGTMPGAIGKVTTSYGVPVQEIFNPKTGRIEQYPILPSMGSTTGSTQPPAQPPSSALPKPAIAPQAPTSAIAKAPAQVTPATQTAPTVTAGAPQGGPLTTAPPATPLVAKPTTDVAVGAKPGQQLASLNANDVFDVNPKEGTVSFNRNKLDRIAATQKIEMPDYNLDKPKTPMENAAKEAVQFAINNPPFPTTLPNRTQEGFAAAEAAKTPMGQIDALKHIEKLEKSDQEALTDRLKAQDKRFAELQKANQDNEIQAGKLGPGVKVARRLLDSPDFVFGPLSAPVETIRGLQEQGEKFFRGMAEDDKKANKDPSFWNNMADLVHNDKSATANQVYRKVLSGSILQSLREMLGPNAGQFRVQELKMLEQAFGNPNLTLNANKVVMDMIDRVNDRMMLVGEMTNKYLETHQTLDPSFERALSRFERQHPTFDNDEYDKLLNIAATGKETGLTPTGGSQPAPGVLGTPAPSAPKYKLPPGFKLE